MGWTEQIPNLVIIETGAGFTGFFVYTPAPGHNNLLASLTASTAGTDPYGNAFITGGLGLYLTPDSTGELTFIGPRGYQMRSGQSYEGQHAKIAQDVNANNQLVMFMQGFANNTAGLTDSAQITVASSDSGGVVPAQVTLAYETTTAVTTAFATVDYTGFNAIGTVTAADPTVTVSRSAAAQVETWKSLGSITATGFTSNIGQYRLLPDGDLEVDVKLTANAGGGTAGVYSYGTTLAAPYRPPTTRIYPLGWNSTMVAGAATNALIVNSTGVVQVKLNALVAATIAGTTARVPLNI